MIIISWKDLFFKFKVYFHLTHETELFFFNFDFAMSSMQWIVKISKYNFRINYYYYFETCCCPISVSLTSSYRLFVYLEVSFSIFYSCLFLLSLLFLYTVQQLQHRPVHYRHGKRRHQKCPQGPLLEWPNSGMALPVWTQFYVHFAGFL